MKKQILNLGASAVYDLVVNFGLNDSRSISDFDDFVFDLKSVRGIDPDTYVRWQRYIRDLVFVKGGIVICLLIQVARNGHDSGFKRIRLGATIWAVC